MSSVFPRLFASAAALAVLCQAAHAQSRKNDDGILPVQVSANVALTSNYVFRGISQTDNGPAIQGGFDVSALDWIYAGVWASSVDFQDSTTMEIDLYAGITPSIGPVTFDLGATYYAYPDSPELLFDLDADGFTDRVGDQDFYEVSAGAGVDIPLGTISAGVAYSPEFYGETGEAYYVSADIDMGLLDILTASAHYGYSLFEDGNLNDDYADVNAGLTLSVLGLALDARYYDTFGRSGADDETGVITISKTF